MKPPVGSCGELRTRQGESAFPEGPPCFSESVGETPGVALHWRAVDSPAYGERGADSGCSCVFAVRSALLLPVAGLR